MFKIVSHYGRATLDHFLSPRFKAISIVVIFSKLVCFFLKDIQCHTGQLMSYGSSCEMGSLQETIRCTSHGNPSICECLGQL